jgi:hypothetical protein
MKVPVSPVQGPYNYPLSSSYHSTNASKYNRVITATATFYATGSNVNPAAFILSGSSGATVTLTNGGQLQLPAAAAAYPGIVHEMSVYSVDAGTVFLLYR